MRSRRIIDKKSGFDGGLKHYHRASNSDGKNWNAWVDGVSDSKVKSRNWQQIFIVGSGVLALIGLIVGLIIKLR